MRWYEINALLMLCAVSASVASGAVINVDVQAASPASTTYVGTAAAPDAPANTKWNVLAGGGNSVNLADTTIGEIFTTSNLVTSANTATGIDFSLTSAGDTDAPNYFTGFGFSGAGNDLFKDYQYTSSGATPGSSTFTFSSLPAGSYDLYVYVEGSITVGAQTLAADGSNQSFTASGLNKAYVIFTGLTPSGGTITGTFNRPLSGYDALYGFQLVHHVPEPGAIFLIIASTMSFATRRRVA